MFNFLSKDAPVMDTCSWRGRRRRDDEKGRELIRFAGAQELDGIVALPIPPPFRVRGCWMSH